MSRKKLVQFVECKACGGSGQVPKLVEVKPVPRPKPLEPLSPGLREKLPSMTPAQRYTAIRIEHNLCAQCGNEPIASKSRRFGEACLKKFRARARKDKKISRKNWKVRG